MSPKLRQRTALLLIAVMAMLPLQGIQAALIGPGSGPVSSMHATGHTHTDHGKHPMQAMADCPMHHAGSGKMPGGSHCNGGCDMCGACSAAIPPGLQPQPVSVSAQLTPVFAASRHPAQPAYPLFRPPRA